MNDHERKIEIMRKYADGINRSDLGNSFHIKGDIPSKKIDNALATFAIGLDRTTIIGFLDTTVLNSGKEGFIFTDDKVVYKEIMEKPRKLWYDDILEVKIVSPSFLDDKKKVLRFELTDGSYIEWGSEYLNKTPLLHFFEDILEYISLKSAQDISVKYDSKKENMGDIAGAAMGHYGNVNKAFDEEKFHASQGHGFAAERANDLFDKIVGHDAKIVGDDNAKNGADRIVDGVEIQSKYCATGSRCVNECFADDGKGAFRYMANGKPMQIEVPSDKYDAAVQAMEEKIRRGQVPGVSDPAEAKNIIRKGHFTYQQAKNIAKAGTVESVTYDAVNGMIIGASAFGISSVLTFAVSVWNGESMEVALKSAAFSGLKVGGTAFITSVLAGQLSKAGLNSALVGSSELIAKAMGPKASAVIINAFRGSAGNIYGAAAMKSFAKLLRGNAITAVITISVLSSFDVANIFKGKISGKQLFKNVTNTTATTLGGIGGWVAGSWVAGQVLVPIPVLGGLCGLAGSVIVGSAAGKVSSAVTDRFIEDDAEEMVRIIEKVFGELANDYLLNQKEAEKCVDRLREILDGKKLKDMFASSDRRMFARDMLTPIIEKEVSKRKKISLPTNELMVSAVREILEEIYDKEIAIA